MPGEQTAAERTVDQDQLKAFMAAIRSMESGGKRPGGANYTVSGPSTRYGRATGAYQFLDSTWGGYGGYRSAKDAPPAVQDARAAQLMTQYFKTYRRWDLVAVAWHGGPGKANQAMRNGMASLGSLNDGITNTVDYAAWVAKQAKSIVSDPSVAQQWNVSTANNPSATTPGGGPASQPSWGEFGPTTDASGVGAAAGAAAAAAGTNISNAVARSADDALGTSSGGPGTVGVASIPVAESFGDGTVDMSDAELVDGEVEAKYGDLSDEEFLTEIYEDVLGRDPDKQGFDYWLGQLGSGVSRSDVWRGFYASEEGGETEPPLLSEVELMIRQKYPDWAWALDNAEVRDILLEATDPTRGMDDVTFLSRIRDTEWWKTTENTVREWDARSAQDPATAQREIEKVAAELSRRATTLGAELTTEQMMALAERVLRFGLTESEINDALAATFDSSDPRGDVAANLRQARELARTYMVNLNDDELVAWAQQVAVGTASPDDLQTRVIELAKAKYGQNDHLLKLIESGSSVSAYFSDHQRLVAQELDMSADQVDLMDPKYARILSSATGDVIRPMDLNETRQHIRENAEFGWEQSSTGRATIAETTNAMLRAFGKVA